MKKILLISGAAIVLFLIIAAVPQPQLSRGSVPVTVTITGGVLYTNGVAVGSLGGGGTNYFNGTGVSSPNFQNNTNITWNISGTNITLTLEIGTTETNLILNFYSQTNIYHVSKGGTLIASNSLSIQPVKTNMLATTETGLVTNVNYGTGISWDPVTRTISSTASGGSFNTHVTTLGWSGTNLTGFNCATNGESFYVLATNNFHFGSSTFSNLQNKDANMSYILCVQQDSTGGRLASFTNSIVGWALATPVFIETNANAVSYVYFHTDLATNSTLVGTGNIDVRR